MKLTRWVCAASLLVLASGLGGWRFVQENTPLYTTGADVPDAAQAGNPEAAMEHSRKLLAMLRDANWDLKKVPWEARLLPDRRFAEKPDMRSDRVTSYCFSCADPSPEYQEVAFYTGLYARQNTSRYTGRNGPETRSRPTGFYIVGWKDGTVNQVLVQDVRLYRTSRGTNIPVFPGMNEYDPNARRLPFVEDAAPPDPALVQALAKLRPAAVHKEHKPGDNCSIKH